MRVSPLIILTLLLVGSACSSSDDEFTVSSIGEAAKTTQAEAAPLVDEVTTTIAPTNTSTTTEPSNAIVTSAEDAGELVGEYVEDLARYTESALVGDGARVNDLEEAVTGRWSDGANVDVGAVHTCLSEGFLTSRAFLDEGAEFESTVDVTEVVEVRVGLWIVEYDTTLFVTGFGDILNSGAAYVGPDGFVGGRPDGDEPSCFEQNRSPDEITLALAADAAAADA